MKVGRFNLREVHFRWIGIFILALIMSFVHPLDPGESKLHKYFVSLTFTSIYWNGAFQIFIYYRKRYPLIKQTPKRLLITFLTLASFLVIGDPVICMATSVRPMEEFLQADYWMFNGSLNLVLSLIIGSIYENAYFFDQWKHSIKVNEALKNQKIRTQFEVLQNQMSPHFLFNSLNTLTTLIAEDSGVAIKFTEKLSEVYRYILQNKEKEVVRLKEELEFVKNYVFLLKIRYPENLEVNFEVDQSFSETSVAPLTIQILVENAIKHNVISKTKPLKIDVYVDNGKSIVVKNNLQKKKTIEKSTKTGLANIHKRYEYFGKKNIDVITTANNFMVAVPLFYIAVREAQLTSAEV